MKPTTHVPREAWIPLLVGLYWLWSAPGHGFFGFFFSVLPGSLLLASGVAMLLMPGDLRISQFAAAGGVLGAIFALPAFVVVGFAQALLLVGGSLASLVAAGHHTMRLEPHPEEIPALDPSLKVSAQIALDEAILSTMQVGMRRISPDDLVRIPPEIDAAREQFAVEGWLEKPEAYHVEPPPLVEPRIERAVLSAAFGKLPYEHMRFESEYEPRANEPGRDRWLSYSPNRQAHAWVMRHSGDERPWLVCIHGYQMGRPGIDIRAFRPEWVHDKLGVNLVLPVLPLHGPRSIGRRSGEGFLAGDILDTVHAEANAMWDIRRILSWVRTQTSLPVGVHGLSLGGYNAALLSSLEGQLACTIAGIPATDLTRLFYRHSPSLQLREGQFHGLVEEHMEEVLRVVSPLALEPKVPHERRFIYAGIGDRLVPADQVRDLWRHWDRPRIEWYQGAHLTFSAHAGVRSMVRDALREAEIAA